MKYQVVREGGLFVVKMDAEAFADFAFEIMESKAEDEKPNGESTRSRRGRPPKDSQPSLAEEN